MLYSNEKILWRWTAHLILKRVYMSSWIIIILHTFDSVPSKVYVVQRLFWWFAWLRQRCIHKKKTFLNRAANVVIQLFWTDHSLHQLITYNADSSVLLHVPDQINVAKAPRRTNCEIAIMNLSIHLVYKKCHDSTSTFCREQSKVNSYYFKSTFMSLRTYKRRRQFYP